MVSRKYSIAPDCSALNRPGSWDVYREITVEYTNTWFIDSSVNPLTEQIHVVILASKRLTSRDQRVLFVSMLITG